MAAELHKAGWVVIPPKPARDDQCSAAPTPSLAQLRQRPSANRREALDEPFRAFPSWFLRVICDRCGQQRMFSETHAAQRDMLIRDLIARMRHDGCGGRAGKVETG